MAKKKCPLTESVWHVLVPQVVAFLPIWVPTDGERLARARSSAALKVFRMVPTDGERLARARSAKPVSDVSNLVPTDGERLARARSEQSKLKSFPICAH